MGQSRSNRRVACGTLYRLYEGGSMMGRVLRYVTPRLAAQRVAEGKWREVYYADSESFAGYQPLEAPQPHCAAKTTGAKAVIEMAKEATITLTELRMNAGEFGASHTAGMPEWERERRVLRALECRRIVALDDAVELAREKIRLWPYPANVLGTDDKGAPIFGDKAVRVYPRAPAARKA